MNANPAFADDEMISFAVENNWKKGRVTHLQSSRCRYGRSFDDFTSCTNNIFVLNVDQSRDEGYSCTCKQYAKEFFCLHSVGIAIIRGTLVPPRRAMVILLGRKRKVGRKPMTALGWSGLPKGLTH